MNRHNTAELANEILDYIDLLTIILSGEDAASATSGMHRISLKIRQNTIDLIEGLGCKGEVR